MPATELLLLVSLLVITGGCGGSRDRLRPSPSHDLPVLDLLESKDKRYDPRPEDLNPRVLRERLGRAFDQDFMSESRPVESILRPNGSVEVSFRRTRRGKVVPASRMPDEIRHLRLHTLRLPDGSRFRMKVGRKMRRRFRQMLWAYTYCPVAYRWKDLGSRFWPRWLKEGSCLTLGSCSFPAGMSCRPRGAARKTLLRWHCGDWARRRLCRWIQVSVPVVTECGCGC